MKCYNHNDRDAFGICSACGKGLCLECMDTSEHIVTCKGNKQCIERAIAKNKAYVISNSYSSVSCCVIGILSMMAGVVTIFYGIFAHFGIVPIILGAIFFLFGISSIRAARKIGSAKN